MTSRYRTEPAVEGPDARGRLTLADISRPLPAVSGSFHHVLADGERLDQLADKYYGEPLAWWQICDANAAFLSPWALLGQEPVTTTTFVITPTAATDTWVRLWGGLFRALTALAGVESVAVAGSAADDDPRVGRRISVTVNRLTPTRPPNTVIVENGFTIIETIAGERTGEQIVIPPVEGG